MGWILLVIILETILYKQLHKVMGLKSLKDEGESDLGIREMNVEFMASYNLPDVLHSSITLSRSRPNSS